MQTVSLCNDSTKMLVCFILFFMVTFKSKPGINKDDNFNAPKAQIKNADDVTRV